MHSGRWMLAGLSLVLAACGGADDAMDDSAMDSAAAMTDTAMGGAGGASAMVQANAVDNSGVSGQVTLTASGEQTMVEMHLTGAPPNASLAAHIHSGTCENKGPAVAPLDTVRTDASGMGMNNATANIPFATANDGQHFVQFHLPNGQPAACGNIAARTM